MQSLITAWTSITSYLWTSLIALYFFIHFVCNQAAAFAKLTLMWVVIAWIFPLPILLPLLFLGKLGYSRYAASNYCSLVVGGHQSCHSCHTIWSNCIEDTYSQTGIKNYLYSIEQYIGRSVYIYSIEQIINRLSVRFNLSRRLITYKTDIASDVRVHDRW